MAEDKKRDLYSSQTSTKDGNYDQEQMARSSGDNDMDRRMPTDERAAGATQQAYFNEDDKNERDRPREENNNTNEKKPEKQEGQGLHEQDESLKNSK